MLARMYISRSANLMMLSCFEMFVVCVTVLMIGLGMRFLQNPLQRCASWGTLILLCTAKIAEMNELDR